MDEQMMTPEPKKSKRVLVAAVAVAVAVAVGLVTKESTKYKPKYHEGDCLIIHPKKDGVEYPPSALIFKGMDGDKYKVIMVVGMVEPRGILVEVKQADEDIAEANPTKVDCETGQPLSEAIPESSASQAPTGGQ